MRINIQRYNGKMGVDIGMTRNVLKSRRNLRIVMRMKLKPSEILESIKKREGTARKAVNMYLRCDLWEKFQLACEDVSPSKVVEVLMQEFMDALKNESRGK